MSSKISDNCQRCFDNYLESVKYVLTTIFKVSNIFLQLLESVKYVLITILKVSNMVLQLSWNRQICFYNYLESAKQILTTILKAWKTFSTADLGTSSIINDYLKRFSGRCHKNVSYYERFKDGILTSTYLTTSIETPNLTASKLLNILDLEKRHYSKFAYNKDYNRILEKYFTLTIKNHKANFDSFKKSTYFQIYWIQEKNALLEVGL